jgi:hypothetical protein
MFVFATDLADEGVDTVLGNIRERGGLEALDWIRAALEAGAGSADEERVCSSTS